MQRPNGPVGGRGGGRPGTNPPATRAHIAEKIHQVILSHSSPTTPGGSTKGIDAGAVQNLTGFPPEPTMQAINDLLSASRIALFKDQTTGVVHFKANSLQHSQRMGGLSKEERDAYNTIIDSKDQGTSNRDLQKKLGLPLANVKKILTKLKDKNLVKDVKSVHARKTLLWLGYDVTPAEDVSGGCWYRDGELQTEMIQQLSENVLEFLSEQIADGGKMAELTLPEVAHALNMPDQESQIGQILRVLELDGLIRVKQSVQFLGGMTETMVTYSALKPIPTFKYDNVQDIPCLRCPVRSECTTKSLNEKTANPTSCIYLTAWLYGVPMPEFPNGNGQNGHSNGNGNSLAAFQSGETRGGVKEGGIDDALAAYHPGVLGDGNDADNHMLSDDEPAGKESKDDDEDF